MNCPDQTRNHAWRNGSCFTRLPQPHGTQTRTLHDCRPRWQHPHSPCSCPCPCPSTSHQCSLLATDLNWDAADPPIPSDNTRKSRVHAPAHHGAVSVLGGGSGPRPCRCGRGPARGQGGCPPPPVTVQVGKPVVAEAARPDAHGCCGAAGRDRRVVGGVLRHPQGRWGDNACRRHTQRLIQPSEHAGS